jgi:hypothetical protein
LKEYKAAIVTHNFDPARFASLMELDTTVKRGLLDVRVCIHFPLFRFDSSFIVLCIFAQEYETDALAALAKLPKPE